MLACLTVRGSEDPCGDGLEHLTPEDWSRWRHVRLEALAEAPNAFGSSLYWGGHGDTEKRWRDRLQDVPLNVLAVIDGRGVGQVSGTAPADQGNVELISLWVAPDVRGRGIGDALVRAVVQWAQAHGAAIVKLAVQS